VILKRRDFLIVTGVGLLGALADGSAHTTDSDLAAWWKFDELDGTAALDSAGQIADSIGGQFARVPGIAGNCLRSYEADTVIVRKAAAAPALEFNGVLDRSVDCPSNLSLELVSHSYSAKRR
jgi:hypothetical protein